MTNDDNREEVDTTATHVPMPDYYIIRHDSGMNHLVRPRDATDVINSDGAGTVTTVCGNTHSDVYEGDLLHIGDLFSSEEVLEYLGSDEKATELFETLEWFQGNCKTCVAAHDYSDVGSFMYEL